MIIWNQVTNPRGAAAITLITGLISSWPRKDLMSWPGLVSVRFSPVGSFQQLVFAFFLRGGGPRTGIIMYSRMFWGSSFMETPVCRPPSLTLLLAREL